MSPLVTRRSVRAILFDARGQLLLIKRIKPDQPLYWTAPGGGVEPGDADLVAALHRELDEELGATVNACQQVFSHSSETETGVSVQHFFVCRLISLDRDKRSGPEFKDPQRGNYDIDIVSFSKENLARIDLKPAALKYFVQSNRQALLNLVQSRSNGT
jgi:ADP-ribose pyrophosphatase YjhB (NUDIX family)